MSEDHRPKPHSDASRSRETTAGESSMRPLMRSLLTSANNIVAAPDTPSIQNQPRRRFHHALRKFKKNVIKKVAERLKRSRTPAVQNTDHEGASSNQNIECLHHSDGDQHTTSGEPTSKALDAPLGVEVTQHPEFVDAKPRSACEGTESMEHVTSVASTAKDGPQDLDAADNFQTTYLHPLKIFDIFTGELANVDPHSKVVLGVLSAASKIILAQTERDPSTTF
ncbi:hypothetical protein BDR03DRAFT_71527 [Suillus americanus]|nr:hypothetical protein BDR03DRAFT_71527 [Suillus americanus]